MLVSQSDGFADTRLDWRPDRGEKIPAQYTLRSGALGAHQRQSGRARRRAGGQRAGRIQQPPGSNRNRARKATISAGPFGLLQPPTRKGDGALTASARKRFARSTAARVHPEYVGSRSLFVSRDADAEKQLLAGTYILTGPRGQCARQCCLIQTESCPGRRRARGPRGRGGRRETKTQPDGTFSVAAASRKELLTAQAEGLPRRLWKWILDRVRAVSTQAAARNGPETACGGPNGKPVAKAGVWLDTFERGRHPNLPDKKPAPVQVDFDQDR